jgi:hypothetical protein
LELLRFGQWEWAAMDAPVDAVSGASLMADCAEFARWMKLSGTADERRSMEYVQARLEGFGYRCRMLTHDAYISLPGAARVVADGQSLKAITHSFSVAGCVGGRLSYVGDATEAEFSRRDLRGHIVLVEGIASPAAAARAARAGAAGQLHISPHEHLHEMCISPVWGSPSASTLAAMPATVTCTISRDDGAALRERLAGGEAAVVTLAADVDTGWRSTPILEADMDGPAADGPFILFSGHHDTWYYGVMDNGSANATMIECARVLAQQRAQWRRGFRLCFWSGHSHGRYSGSAWYADNYWEELDRRCAVHVNVDSTGGVGASVMTESGVAAELAPLAARSIRAETNLAHAGRRLGRNSDMSFWGIGIPSMFGALSYQPAGDLRMRNDLGWWWHTPEDLLDKIDEANLVRDTRVFVRTLWALLTDPVLPLDYPAHAAGLLEELGRLEQALAGRLDIAPLRARAAALRDVVGVTDDKALMAASRALVPLDYTTGDRFSHDPALPQAPWPVLDPIRALARADAVMVPFSRVDAIRARNRVLHALDQAGRALAG